MLRRARQQAVPIVAIDSTVPPARKSGLTLLTTDCKISKDGGSFANSSNAPTELGSTGRYSLVLTAAELDCVILHLYIEKTGMQPFDQTYETTGHPSGSVVSGTLTTTAFSTDLTSSADDFWKDVFVTFTAGALEGQTRKVSAYNGTSKVLTLTSALSAAPSAGDRFVLIDV